MAIVNNCCPSCCSRINQQPLLLPRSLGGQEAGLIYNQLIKAAVGERRVALRSLQDLPWFLEGAIVLGYSLPGCSAGRLCATNSPQTSSPTRRPGRLSPHGDKDADSWTETLFAYAVPGGLTASLCHGVFCGRAAPPLSPLGLISWESLKGLSLHH